MADKIEFPYSAVPGNLRKILEMIPNMGTPPKATQKWLAGIGFSSGNDKRNLAVMRQVGIISPGGEPTDLWTAFRSRDKVKIAAGIRRHYSGLFGTFPDAHRKDDEALLAYIRSTTEYGEKAQRLALRVFRNLCEFGDFDADADPEDLLDPDEEDEQNDRNAGKTGGGRTRIERVGGGVGLTVNIQIQLPPSEDGEVYDKVFEAMGRHLKTLIAPQPDEQ
jgi:hypothetical protein